ncbi:MAG: DNA methylase, partial [Proteobacteria bacterium]
MLAYITTDAFLNGPSNREAREHLFRNADFVSAAVLPDNLMKDTGNTEAPSHLLIVQKHSGKTELSDIEQELLQVTEQSNEYGSYYSNSFLADRPQLTVCNEIKPGKNQYGKAHQTVWQNDDIDAIAGPLSAIVSECFHQRFSRAKFELNVSNKDVSNSRQLTFLPLPEADEAQTSVQLGLFDIAPAAANNKASAYLSLLDATIVDKKSARILNSIKATDKPDHEAIVMMVAKSLRTRQYVYKLYSNVAEIDFPASWMNASSFHDHLNRLPEQLLPYNHQFYNEGELSFYVSFKREKEAVLIKEPNPYHRVATLIVHDNQVGHLS